MRNRVWQYYGIALLVLLLDQGLKLWVYSYMQLGEAGQIKIFGNWFKLFYTLNPGMAFGLQFGFRYDKIILTLIRVIATYLIIRYIWKVADRKSGSIMLLWGWALVLGGAAGNGIDSIFYGKFLHNAPFDAPFTWFYGQVIDMLYIDVWTGYLPSWVPFSSKLIFSIFPVFNLADVAILVGIGLVFFVKEKAELIDYVQEDFLAGGENQRVDLPATERLSTES